MILTKKQKTAIKLLDKGMTKKDISIKLNITEKTCAKWIAPVLKERKVLNEARTQLILRIAKDVENQKSTQSIKNLAYSLQTIIGQIRQLQ